MFFEAKVVAGGLVTGAIVLANAVAQTIPVPDAAAFDESPGLYAVVVVVCAFLGFLVWLARMAAPLLRDAAKALRENTDAIGSLQTVVKDLRKEIERRGA